jgi:hypothetical protein
MENLPYEKILNGELIHLLKSCDLGYQMLKFYAG